MIPEWLFLLPLNLIGEIADRHDIDRQLIAAIVMTESTGRPCAIKYEAPFIWLNDPDGHARALNISEKTEIQNQKHSWGLMQIMGGTARDMGFRDLMPKLCIPRVGLEFGTRYLKNRINRYGIDDVERLYAAYNAGTPKPSDKPDKRFKNQDNVDKFMGYYRDLKPEQ
jgi:soluble lytic murein transglycosylase-like protein